MSGAPPGSRGMLAPDDPDAVQPPLLECLQLKRGLELAVRRQVAAVVGCSVDALPSARWAAGQAPVPEIGPLTEALFQDEVLEELELLAIFGCLEVADPQGAARLDAKLRSGANMHPSSLRVEMALLIEQAQTRRQLSGGDQHDD